MDPQASLEHVRGYFHVYDQEVVRIFYLIEANFDRDFPQRSMSSLAKALMIMMAPFKMGGN